MKNIKKVVCAIVLITMLSLCLISNYAYADDISVTDYPNKVETPLYYFVIIVVILMVIGVSVLLLLKLHKKNHGNKEEGIVNDESEKE